MSLAILQMPPLPDYTASRVFKPNGCLVMLKPGTLAAEVFEYFIDNRGEELFEADIAIKWAVDRQSVATKLARSVATGFLHRVIAMYEDEAGNKNLQHLYSMGRFA